MVSKQRSATALGWTTRDLALCYTFRYLIFHTGAPNVSLGGTEPQVIKLKKKRYGKPIL